jgi:hypothetical protein
MRKKFDNAARRQWLDQQDPHSHQAATLEVGKGIAAQPVHLLYGILLSQCIAVYGNRSVRCSVIE